jgi:hypothetical protein
VNKKIVHSGIARFFHIQTFTAKIKYVKHVSSISQAKTATYASSKQIRIAHKVSKKKFGFCSLRRPNQGAYNTLHTFHYMHSE